MSAGAAGTEERTGERSARPSARPAVHPVAQPTRPIILAALIGVASFLYTAIPGVLSPTRISWLLEGDRATHLAGWLFSRNEPWHFPLGVVHGLLGDVPTTTGYTDSIPWMAALGKLLLGWVAAPVQYSGIWLLGCFALQGVFGYLLLRALGARPSLAVVGSAFFTLSPVLLARYEHMALSAQWMVLAALWLAVRPAKPGARRRRLVLPWLALVVVAASTHPYLTAMVLPIAAAAAVRYGWVDRSLSRTGAVALFGGLIAAALATFWVWGYFLLPSTGEPGFGIFSIDALAFIDSSPYARILPPIAGLPIPWFESYMFLGVGLVALGVVAVAIAVAGRARVPRWPAGIGPVSVISALMFIFALATPIHVAGHPVLSLAPLYAHLWRIPGTFRVSARFGWPAYYLVIAVIIASLARIPRPAAVPLALAALLVQVIDLVPLHVAMHGTYTVTFPEMNSPVLRGVGRDFHALHLVPPIIAHHMACPKFSYAGTSNQLVAAEMLAAREHLTFNSGNLGRSNVPALDHMCDVQADSLRRGLIDPGTILVALPADPSEIAPWAETRLVCAPLDRYIVCTARGLNTRLTRWLEAQHWTPPAKPPPPPITWP